MQNVYGPMRRVGTAKKGSAREASGVDCCVFVLEDSLSP